MRFLIMHKSNEENEAGIPPSKELVEGVGKLMEESAQAGCCSRPRGYTRAPEARFSSSRAESEQ